VILLFDALFNVLLLAWAKHIGLQLEKIMFNSLRTSKSDEIRNEGNFSAVYFTQIKCRIILSGFSEQKGPFAIVWKRRFHGVL